MPVYGSKEKWSGDLAKQSTAIKELDFKKKVKACPRIDRTLVYQRQHDLDFKLNNSKHNQASNDLLSIDIGALSHRDATKSPVTSRGAGQNITPNRFQTIGDNISRL